jgi:hypothetical protein
MTIVFPKWVTKLGATLVGVAAFLELLQTQVLALLANVGITLPADLALWVAVLGGVLAALGKALGDADGDGIPDGLQRRGTTALRTLLLLLTIVGIAGLAVAACGAGRPNVLPAPNALSVVSSTAADSAIVRVRCSVGAETTCRWAATVGGATVAGIPDGLEARLAFVAPAPGDSVLVTASARAVRRGLVSAGAATAQAWVKRTDVPPGAPDSVIVIDIVIPPATN